MPSKFLFFQYFIQAKLVIFDKQVKTEEKLRK